MIQITPQMRILVAVESVDFRKGIDSLAELCRSRSWMPIHFSGYLFVFRSRRATSIKVLVYDGCRDSGWRPSACPKDASAGGPR